MMQVALKTSNGNTVKCAACFSIKRDVFDLPVSSIQGIRSTQKNTLASQSLTTRLLFFLHYLVLNRWQFSAHS